MLLFFSVSMFAYTILIGTLVFNYLAEELSLWQNSVEQAAYNITEQLLAGNVLNEEDLNDYLDNSGIWIKISDTTTTSCYFKTEPTYLLEQIYSYSGPSYFPTTNIEYILSHIQKCRILRHLFFSSSGEETSDENSIIRITYSIKGLHEDYYDAVQVIPFSSPWTITLIQYRLSVWDYVCSSSCQQYLYIWLVVLVLMYLMSRILIMLVLIPVEASLKSQKNFIAAASHELKSPLAVIQANAELLPIKEEDLTLSNKQHIIIEECNRMTYLIQSLLALAASDAGNLKLNYELTDIDTLLIEILESYQVLFQRKAITFQFNLEKECFPKLNCDKERISQVIHILFDNAISYAGTGATICLSAKHTAKYMEFRVIDNGPGIPNDKKHMVFERFYSGEESHTDKNHYGLGLSIAKEIVKAHHGSIVLQDTPQGGCTFIVQIPYKR